MTAALMWLVLQIGIPFLVLVFANNLLRCPHRVPGKFKSSARSPAERRGNDNHW